MSGSYNHPFGDVAFRPVLISSDADAVSIARSAGIHNPITLRLRSSDEPAHPGSALPATFQPDTTDSGAEELSQTANDADTDTDLGADTGDDTGDDTGSSA
jgi:hypothetical protein